MKKENKNLHEKNKALTSELSAGSSVTQSRLGELEESLKQEQEEK
jgi:hypothetical protein